MTQGCIPQCWGCLKRNKPPAITSLVSSYLLTSFTMPRKCCCSLLSCPWPLTSGWVSNLKCPTAELQCSDQPGRQPLLSPLQAIEACHTAISKQMDGRGKRVIWPPVSEGWKVVVAPQIVEQETFYPATTATEQLTRPTCYFSHLSGLHQPCGNPYRHVH